MTGKQGRSFGIEQLERREVLSVTFVDTGQDLGASGTRALALGDLDGDGDLDIFSVGQSGEVWLNDGNGFFADKGKVLGNSSGNDVVLGDVDGDADLDVVIHGLVRLNDGTGRYSTVRRLWINGATALLGDLDNDGDLDAVGEGSPSGGGYVWLNDGTGRFKQSPELLGSTDESCLVNLHIADMDGDHDLDIIGNRQICDGNVILATVNTEIWLNQGDATFTESDQSLSGRPRALGDADGDGDLDAIVWRPYRSIRMLINDGQANLTDIGRIVIPESLQDGSPLHGVRDVQLADIDGDGDRDIVFKGDSFAPTSMLSGLFVSLNEGNAVFELTVQIHEFGIEGFRSSALGDLDGNGLPDVVLAKELGVEVWLNYSEPITYEPGDSNRDDEFNQLDVVQVLRSAKYLTGEPATWSEGDWNNDGVFDRGDIVIALQADNYLPGPDVGRGGDANLDGEFNIIDLIIALQSAKYLTSEPATWSEGDWNADVVFDQLDIIAAWQTGNYLHRPYGDGLRAEYAE